MKDAEREHREITFGWVGAVDEDHLLDLVFGWLEERKASRIWASGADSEGDDECGRLVLD